MFDTDHLNTFFLDACRSSRSASTRPSGRRTTSRATCRTTWCRRRPASPRISGRPAIEAGFDVGMTQNFSVDHSVTVPLHFLTPDMNVPVVPFFISGHVPPLPSAQRCYALGQAVGRAIESWPENKRVVVMGSGSFSLEVGGPRMAPGRTDGVPDPDWCARVIKLLESQQIDTLIKESTRASDAQGRQCRRRIAELDRHARRDRQPQAELCRAADAERPRLRRVAVELRRNPWHDQRQGRRGILQAARLRHQDRLRRAAGADRHRHAEGLHRRRRCRSAPTSTSEIAAQKPLLDVAHERNIPVIFSTVIYNDHDLKDAGLWAIKMKGTLTLKAGTDGGRRSIRASTCGRPTACW